MAMGSAILLLALGAVLAFATTFDLPGIDLQMVGIILMITGVIGLLLDVLFFRPRRRAATTTYVDTAPTREVVREREIL